MKYSLSANAGASQIEHSLKIGDVLLECSLSPKHFDISIIELNVSSSLFSSSSCLSTLGCMMFSDTACITGAYELVLGLSPQSKEE